MFLLPPTGSWKQNAWEQSKGTNRVSQRLNLTALAAELQLIRLRKKALHKCDVFAPKIDLSQVSFARLLRQDTPI